MMMLYEDNKFSLDDPISKHMPEFANLTVLHDESATKLNELKRPPTMRDLMSHTAGFTYGTGKDPLKPFYKKNDVYGATSLEEFTDRLAKVPLRNQPGERWNYSVSVDIQGAMIERLSGKRLDVFLKEELFDPLGMKDTRFRIPDHEFDRLADTYIVNPFWRGLIKLPEFVVDIFGVEYREDSERLLSGGGGLSSTIIDYGRFCQMLANRGEFEGKRYLNAETINLMRTNILPVDQPLTVSALLGDSGKPGTGFGLNFGVVFDSELSTTPYGQGTYFWGGFSSTWFWIDPENDFFYIGMVQVFPGIKPVADFRRQTADQIYRALHQTH
ncbi:MAG: beta-lactamase family protein, partial [Acidiferrobacterales bacterium]|nr:beta-lactamase family protein [Acidiferrobacterales bacterium]